MHPLVNNSYDFSDCVNHKIVMINVSRKIQEGYSPMSQSSAPQPRPRSPLFRWRTERNLSQEQAAELLDLSQSQYSQYESGNFLPRPPLLKKITEHSAQPMLGAAMALYYHRITPEEAAWYFRLVETT
jgi:DNA-binding XRE family transcriptional regulator